MATALEPRQLPTSDDSLSNPPQPLKTLDGLQTPNKSPTHYFSLRPEHDVIRPTSKDVGAEWDGNQLTTSPSTHRAPADDGFPFHKQLGGDTQDGERCTTPRGAPSHQTGAQSSFDDALPSRGASEDFTTPEDSPIEPRRKSSLAGTSTPPARRSVQFARPGSHLDQPGHVRNQSGSNESDDGDITRERKGVSLFSKLRAFTGSSPAQQFGRSQTGFTIGGESIDEHRPAGFLSQNSERDEFRFPDTLDEEGSEIDADAEESTGEDSTASPSARKRRRKSGRPHNGGIQTAPTTPKTATARDGRPAFFSSNSLTPNEGFRPFFLPRRATMTDVTGDNRQGVSEDEGRFRLNKSSVWKKVSARNQSPRGTSYGGVQRPDLPETPEGRRPSHFRRLTGLGGFHDSPDTPTLPWKRLGADRTSSISAQKWRQLKAGIKMIGQRRKAENTIDYAKSAELLAELTAGIPAVLIVASMFQRDENGNKRIPILLEQLKVRVTDSKQMDSKGGDRHMIFRIELEYGNGLTRMKWVIHRALRDFANLHARYKLQIGAQRYIQLKGDDARVRLPHFPRSAFPYLRAMRGLDSDEEEDEEDADETAPSGAEEGVERPGKRKKRRPSLNIVRRKSSAFFSQPNQGNGRVVSAGGGTVGLGPRRDPYPERQRRKLELYLQQMIRYLIFRPESNRLCKFLELSALGVRLAAEGSYHGKEGFLVIQSGKGVDFRRKLTPTLIKGRHLPKWFLIRHSYIVCVDSPEEMNIYDVFLVDSGFHAQRNKKRLRDSKPKDLARSAKDSASHPQHHSLRVKNSERKLKLLAKNERQLHQFEESILFMASNTPWAKPNRFDSFAPVRPGVFAQWLVDGRDYMWNVSRAISMAKDVIYIHDWWLSPELYMRRPAAISQKWRLDRLLQRKAREGVKVFVIMYRNINSAIPIDSEYTKFSLLDLHPNVFVQRSPNQFRLQNAFFWAHHEKVCIVDHTVAFVGGIDLCFGRWDTPQHTVVDDKPTGFELSDKPKDADHCQLWPGKDYSNPRVQDFYALDKPYEEMYDRFKIPRMPWHDISMQVVGQPARDLTRHFVQRWNYILRQRKPTRPTPFLLPPPDFNPADLEALGLDGTCEVQILRSCGWWSMGTPDKTEHSIMNAYAKMIEDSDHFVYIENQFFVTSCEVEGTRIENVIGDALVERIIRASRNNEAWRAVVVIPLMPGFQNTVEAQDGTSIRLIMQCQYRSICRGEASIFGRLRAEGIEPEDYIQFYSLRTWGKIGPNQQLVTEQLYIHAKCMVVDDRIAIIGSANINERSMLGNRDSECAAVVRDTDMLWSTMDGEPYLVGRFPHTLRMRLMREHLGLDVDEIMEKERVEQQAERHDEQWEADMDRFHGNQKNQPPQSPMSDREIEQHLLDLKHKLQDDVLARSDKIFSFNHDVDWEQSSNPNLKVNKKVTEDPRVMGNEEHKKDVEGEGKDHLKEIEGAGLGRGRDTVYAEGKKEVLVSNVAREGRTPLYPSTSPKRSARQDSEIEGNAGLPPLPRFPRMNTVQLGLPMVSQLPPLPATDDTDIGGPPCTLAVPADSSELIHPLAADLKRPHVDKDCMRDPLNDLFHQDIWHTVAENNTKLFRTVFRCMPDNEVKTWKEYKEYSAYSERLAQAQGGKSKTRMEQEAPGKSGPPGQGSVGKLGPILGPISEKAGEAGKKLGELQEKATLRKDTGPNTPMGTIEDWAEEANKSQAIRQQHQRASDLQSSPNNSEILDEKAASRLSNDMPTDHATAKGKHDTAKLQKVQSPQSVGTQETGANAYPTNTRRRRRATTRGSRLEFHADDDLINRADAEDLMKLTQGPLVVWPYDWYVLPIKVRIQAVRFGQ
ncbi:Phospholipase D1 [Acarospora aff. strigata]|nr:Phospholipase D1 [Acarospora aff. strigata]